jgi:hypothetical protein
MVVLRQMIVGLLFSARAATMAPLMAARSLSASQTSKIWTRKHLVLVTVIDMENLPAV